MGGNRGYVLPPIRVTKYGLNHELRKVDLKLTLTNEIISRKIVVSKVETLYDDRKIKRRKLREIDVVHPKHKLHQKQQKNYVKSDAHLPTSKILRQIIVEKQSTEIFRDIQIHHYVTELEALSIW